MKYEVPQHVELTDEESQLYDRILSAEIRHGRSSDDWSEIADSMETLVELLSSRKAIPEVRIQLFVDPKLAESGAMSRQQVFESNETSGSDIIRHPNFVKYLRHFIEGPKLPKPVMQGLCDILNEDRGTSGMLIEQTRKFVRDSIRNNGLDRGYAATEFFRLGIEIGMSESSARSLRDAAMSVR